ncbi:MAG TPA: hypothetical protein VGD64_12585 [Acidisarcina sp.]
MSGAEADELSLSIASNAAALAETGPLAIESDHLRLEICPEWGGKIGSIILIQGNHELLQQPLRPYAPRTSEMPFEEGEASGYDDCIPTVSPCEIEPHAGPDIGPYAGPDAEPDTLSIPDHGDFWRLPFSIASADNSHVTIEATGFSLPLHLRKTISLDGNRIFLDYDLTNVGDIEVQYLWSAHPAFAVEAGDQVELPSSVHNVMVQGSRDERLGAEGNRHPWPLTTTNTGDAVDLSLVGSETTEVADKLFMLAPIEGWCALSRRMGARIEMKFDPIQAPYLGLWLCYGGWPPNQPARQYCVALEPCTAPADSLVSAIGQGLGRKLAPHTSHRWRVELCIT